MKNRVVNGKWIFIFLILILYYCKPGQEKPEIEKIPVREIHVPSFNADTAYYYITKQVDFGPRVPNTQSHRNCSVYLIQKFKNFNAEVTEQDFTQEAYDGTLLYLKNIIASFNPETSRRILLAAHWDTRPYADKDTMDINKPIDGANDGASGVGVLLEIARLLGNGPLPETGIDIILFDGEDYGEPEFLEDDPDYESSDKIWWCLGSQYWSKNKHKSKYSAYYGILVDMVGAKNARFYQEGGSVQFAKKIVNKVWDTGRQIGYDHFFVNQRAPVITDDHIFVNRDGKIPMINIVEYDPGKKDSFFGAYHHTHRDNLDIIDRNTLKAVGQTILHVIYNE